MKKKESPFVKHFSKKELAMMAEFINMLVKKKIWFFSSNLKRNQVAVKYL